MALSLHYDPIMTGTHVPNAGTYAYAYVPNTHFLQTLASMSLDNLYDFDKLHPWQHIYFVVLVIGWLVFAGLYLFYRVAQPLTKAWNQRATLLKAWWFYNTLHILLFLFAPKGSEVQNGFDDGDVFFFYVFLFFGLTSVYFIYRFWRRAESAARAASFRWAFPLAPWVVISICYLLDWFMDILHIPFTPAHEPHMIAPPTAHDMDFDFYLLYFLVLEMLFGQMWSGWASGKRLAWFVVPILRTMIELVACGSPAQYISVWSFGFALLPYFVALIFCMEVPPRHRRRRFGPEDAV